MRVGLAIELSVVLLVECTTAAAQEQSDASRDKGLDRIFRARTRQVVHPNIERLKSALSDMVADPLTKEVASDEIDLARSALDHAIAARRNGRESVAQRAEQMVDAALVLADRKLALVRARTALRATERRAVEAEKAARRAADALEAVMQKRAALYSEQKK